MRELTATELSAHLKDGPIKDGEGKDGAGKDNKSTPLLLDVREPWEFGVCSIEGSRNIPMGQIPAAAAELDAGQETIVVCHHGVRSRQVAVFLEQLGFSDVLNLNGGIDAWAREVDTSMQTY